MKKLFYIFLFFPLLLPAQLFADEEYEYTSEWTWGINKNTNGGLIGGLMLRYSRSAGNDFFETYGLELSNVRHPSEIRYKSQTGAGFTYGKSHYLYAIRLQYGREKLLYRKSSQQGVQISAMAATGPTIGLEAPYYLSIGDEGYRQFGPVNNTNPPTYPPPQVFIGPGRLFQGLGESNVIPGLNIKTSLLFEFGTYRSNVAGVEAGMMIEGYSRKIEIVPSQPNNSVFTSVFFTLFWGSRK
ncbi:MAG: hypothetical protein GDA51_11190 [Ekhidna sp.]|nr:hypothetical protein [Ekhidna sp.]MBC6411191.1 hypothetical protein [Ekhidna sp.]MBC6427003.1 hypothetical protein [Ekhidna sp.]